MNSFLSQFPYLEAVLVLCILVGGFFGIRNGRQTQLTTFQEKTIQAQNDRIKVLEDKISDLEKQNVKQQYVIDTITSGLKQRGLVISVDGELYPIADKSSTHRKRPAAHVPLAREKEEEK